MLLSATLPLNVRIILPDHFSNHSSSYIVCVCYHYCRTNQNTRSMMGLTSHLFCLSINFYYYHVAFLFNLLGLLSFDELDLFNDESNNDGSGFGSPAFLLCQVVPMDLSRFLLYSYLISTEHISGPSLYCQK